MVHMLALYLLRALARHAVHLTRPQHEITLRVEARKINLRPLACILLVNIPPIIKPRTWQEH